MYLRNLVPNPRMFKEDEAISFNFGSKVTAYVSGLDELMKERVKFLWKRFSCDASELELIERNDGYYFVIGECDCELSDGDKYSISVGEKGVCLKAIDKFSLMNGFTTLVQLICPVELSVGNEALYISSAEIHDSPAVEFRAVHICVFPESRLENIMKAINVAGFYKMTHVVLEFWGTLKYDCLPELAWENYSYTKDEIKPLIDLIRSYGMQPIPMVNHFGHAAQSRSCMGRHSVLNKDLRLSKLFEPDGWTWCLSNPDTYKLLADMRAELCELFGEGDYFHLGFDEADSFATCDKCRKRVQHELLAEYINRLTEDVSKLGRRPIIWHDEFIAIEDFPIRDCPIVANGQRHNTAPALDKLDRRAIIADWQYDYKKNFNPTTPYFMEKGFDTLVCPWDGRENIRSLTNNAKALGTTGVLFTTWDRLPNFMRDGGYCAANAWCENDQPLQPITEVASILRRIFDVEGDFELSGWNKREVEQ